jgi:hypothetical protein
MPISLNKILSHPAAWLSGEKGSQRQIRDPFAFRPMVDHGLAFWYLVNTLPLKSLQKCEGGMK